MSFFKSKKEKYRENNKPKFDIGDEVRVREYETGNQYYSIVNDITVRENGIGELYFGYGVEDPNGLTDWLHHTELKHKHDYIKNGWE